MEINWTEIIMTMLTIFTPILTALVSYALVKLNKFLTEKTTAITDDEARYAVERIINDATDAISSAVKVTGQTFVDNVKGTPAWTPEAKAEAFNKTKDTFFALMGEAGMNALESTGKYSEEWLDTKIEEYVAYNKARTSRMLLP